MPITNDEIQINYLPTNRGQSEISDLIGNPPGWLLRSGIMMVAIVTSIILVGSYFFQYPDKLIGQGVLTASNPPIEIISRSTGYIGHIHVKEGEYIEKGSSILYINNTTDQGQLGELISWINKYKVISDPRLYLNLLFTENLQLGDVQGDYANLQLKYNELQQTLKEGITFQQINSISREIEKIRSLNESQQREISIYVKEFTLIEKDFNRKKKLNNEGVISDLDFEQVNTTLLQKERQLEGMNNSIIQNEIRIEQLELEKLRLQEDRGNVIKRLQFSISENISRIITRVESWKNAYIIEAPISGTITFTKSIIDKKNIEQGQILGHIIPISDEKKYISAILPSTNLGKLEKGQKAIIKFDGYPYKEYGVVESEVLSISKIPEMNNEGIAQYEVRIPMNEIIITDYQDTIHYRPNLTAIAEIITEDKSVFERVFDQFFSIINSN